MDASSAYVRSSGEGATPLRMVVLLYDQLVKDLRRAAAKINEVEARTLELDHALKVLGQLQGTLDLTQGEVAANLDRFYSILRANLLRVQVTKSAALLKEQISHLVLLREAWAEVEHSAVQEELVERTSAFTPPEDLDSVADWTG